MAINVFLSYAAKDVDIFHIRELVENLVIFEDIEKILYWSEDIGGNIISFMNDSLGKCDVVLVFCSPNALDSIAVEKEWIAALALNKPVIPIFYDRETIPPLLTPRLGLQFDPFMMQKNITQIYKIILKRLDIDIPKVKPQEIKPKDILIYLSYSLIDTNAFQIRELTERLRVYEGIENVVYWQEDISENHIKFMSDNLGKCDVLLLCCSPNTLDSDIYQKEWEAADMMGKIIIPIFYNTDHIPPLFKPRLGIQFDPFEMQKNISQIYNLILKKTETDLQFLRYNIPVTIPEKFKKLGVNVFLSYAAKDLDLFKIREVAKQLRNYEEINEVIFFDPEYMYDDILDFMEKSVEIVDVFLNFSSPNALKSQAMKMEWMSAIKLSRKIIPIYINSEDIPIILKPMIGVEFDIYNIEKSTRQMYDLILKIVGEESIEEVKPIEEVKSLEETEIIKEMSDAKPQRFSRETEFGQLFKVFFSYVSEDSILFKIERIAELLGENHAIRYFERDLKPGVYIHDFMEESVVWCDVFIWFFTPKVLKSASFTEYKMACIAEKKIISVTENYENLPLRAKTQWAINYQNDVYDLFNKISSGLETYFQEENIVSQKT